MGTHRETIDFILDRFKSPTFTAKTMFGEYAIYANGKIVGLVCNDRLFVKDTPVTASLAEECEKGPPYPGAKPHYIVDEGQITSLVDFAGLLVRLAASLPTPKKKGKRT